MLQQVQCCMTVSQFLQCIMQIRKLITICPQLQELVNGHFKSLKLHIFLSTTHICTANTHPLSTNLVLQAIKIYDVYYMTHCLEVYNIWSRPEQEKNVLLWWENWLLLPPPVYAFLFVYRHRPLTILSVIINLEADKSQNEPSHLMNIAMICSGPDIPLSSSCN